MERPYELASSSTESGLVPSKQPTEEEAQYSNLTVGLSKRHEEGQDIAWSNIVFKVGDKTILENCYGRVNAGQVCALMGPSGSGKSSLLNVLAGRSASGANINISGKVTVAGQIINPVDFRQRIAYVMQDDALMQTATPREALAFSARLRLPPTTSKDEINAIVEKVLSDLGLESCADVMIGGPLIKGISGGQRKRTSIGVEIITNPALLFLDEPTSGLDSFSAQSCVNLFKKLATNNNAAVLCTIHQPSSEVFVLFDLVIFLKEGRVLYQGPVSEVTTFFSKYNHHCPTNFNPADYVMTLIQTESREALKKSGIEGDNEATAALIASGMEQCSETEHKFPVVLKASFFKQMVELSYRESQSIIRNTAALIARFGITIFLNLLYGCIFLNAGQGDNADTAQFQAHYGSVTFVMISAMFGSAQPVMLAFPFERPMFLREHSTGTYSGLAYFISKVLLELPLTFLTNLVQFIIAYFMIGMQGNFIVIVLAAFGLGAASASIAVLLGCLVSDVKQVTEFSTLLFVPQLLFSGFFIRTEQIPVWLRWAQWITSLKYALNIALLNEFRLSSPSCQGAARDNCNSVLTTNSIDPGLWWVYMLCLIALFLVFRIIAGIVLVKKARKFY